MECSICSGARRWLKQPFQKDGSALDWVLFLGLVMAAIFLWSRVLVRIAP